MLPSELLVVRKRKGIIWPRFAKLSDENFEVARSLIETYRRHNGEKQSFLKEFVGELEAKGYEYRFVRGLSILLDRRSVFKCGSRFDPADLRRRIFQAAMEFGVPTKGEDRNRIIETVALELDEDSRTIDESLYADLVSELILEKFNPISAEELLKEYNLSLAQTLLFDSTELNFSASGNWQRIFYEIKKLGLIYEVQQDRGFWVKIDGPASLFKLTRRYGTAVAKLLPTIVSNSRWIIEAKILWKYTNEICDLKMESQKHEALLKRIQLPTVSYDSTVEEDFATRFQALKSRWRLVREPEPVPTGKQVIVPDFSVEREGVKVYIEVVGFWTSEYLLRKIKKLKKVNVDMLVVVNENLACEKLANLGKYEKLNIIFYRKRIPLTPILNHLEKAFRGVYVKQTQFIRNLPVVFTEPVVNYEAFAARIGVSIEAAKTELTENTPSGYVALLKALVRKDKIKQIGKRIEKKMKKERQLSFSGAVEIIEAENVEDTSGVLKTLGYKIVWRGINPEEAEVVRC